MQYVLNFTEVGMNDLPKVGGKNASLGEMIVNLSKLGIRVPNGFATTADAYNNFLVSNGIDCQITDILHHIDINNLDELREKSLIVRNLILTASFSADFECDIRKAYQQLQLDHTHSVAVRSSATAEDLPDASFAGQQETYLNVSGIENVLIAIKRVYASLFTDRAIVYRVHHHFNHAAVAISAGIQKMVRSDCGVSGVIFTLDTESGFDQVVFITASYGLGEILVQGGVNPDEIYVHKPTLKTGKSAIISRKVGSKKIKMIYGSSQDERIKSIDVSREDQQRFCLSDEDILLLAKQAMIIEEHYGKPMDIEWAKDGLSHELYIVQARPDTAKHNNSNQYIEQYQLTEQSKPILIGRSVGQKIGQGRAKILETHTQMNQFQPGDVLVADMTDPDWEPVMKHAAAIITNRGGRTCHAAIVARELGIPAVVGCGNATNIIANNTDVTVSCAEGDAGYVYAGHVNFKYDKIEINNLPKLPIKICMNLANPEQAFTYQFLPNDGIGLTRVEFIISAMIGIHPNAILHPEKISKKIQDEINDRASAYQTPTEFYIEKMAEGIATISAAFYPKPVIVRFSDFKSNEYANLLGGDYFEPHEENPMIGYRGGSRYISDNFKDCFKLECEAIKRVREQKGLMNTHIMFPFVRTVDEAEQIIALTAQYGLVRGHHGLKFMMMCEIPSNAILAEEFLKHFDGYSIGSNDLTQLVLGLDRDSELVAYLFDERNKAVKILLHQIVNTCQKLGKYVGICGQAPSDHPELAKWLMEEGIDSLSLTPDSIVKTWLMLGSNTVVNS